MRLRGQTDEVQTKFVVNGDALKAVRESDQFRIVTGRTAKPIKCRTTASVDVYGTQVLTHLTIKYAVACLLDNDWAWFQRLVREWHVECGTTSSPTEMAMCPAYQRILAMGAPAIPLILRQLDLEGDDPDHWFWALNYLTGEDPVAAEDQGNMRKMSTAWLRWGRNNLLV